jgi:hypothetical protein
MKKALTTSKLVGRALRLALCWMLALQAFAAALSTSLAVDRGSSTDFDPLICHNSGSETPAPGDPRLPSSVPCSLCAIAAGSVSLPDPPLIANGPWPVIDRVPLADVPIVDGMRLARAGLARAPPQVI